MPSPPSPPPPRSSRRWLAALAPLPPVAAGLAVPLIAHCIALARAHGHIPDALRFPPISLAGIHAPEYARFAAGFAALAALLALCEELRARALARPLARALALARALRAPAAGAGANANADANADADACAGPLAAARWAARAACLGLLLTGVVPLQLPAGDPRGEAATAVHGLASAAFFVGSQWHAVATLRALAAPAARALPVSLAAAPALFALRAAAALSSVLGFVPAQLLHPGGTRTSPHPGGPELAQLDAAGFAQWWAVGSLLFYWAIYGLDFVLLASEPSGKNSNDDGDGASEVPAGDVRAKKRS